ncbi:aspartate kinase [Candidatus Fermentibacterales bacterium]|nr:aspartate kinase [Candidatus Fermentibacterales bacterium]
MIVAKFGGTCLQDDRSRGAALEACLGLLGEHGRLVVVVSAMGRAGDPYATDTLSGLAAHADSRERDLVLACGEVISAVVFSSLLRERGVEVRAMTGWEAGIRTDGVVSDSCVSSVDPGAVLEALGRFPCVVVAGFQGMGPDGSVTTLGRGGSDTSAVCLAAALGCGRVLLYKTVESVFTADPEVVPAARPLERVSAEDIRQMAWQGAKVVHPRAAEIAEQASLTIELRSQSTGRTVTTVEPVAIRSGRYVTGVAAGPSVVQVTADGPADVPARDFFDRVFSLIAGEGVSMDLFSVFGSRAVFTVRTDDSEATAGALTGAGIPHTLSGPCRKVSIVGAGMHGMRGVMAHFARALAGAGIDMLQTVDSHATISALVRDGDGDAALRALHEEFIEKPPCPEREGAV